MLLLVVAGVRLAYLRPSPSTSPSPCPGSSQLVGGVLGFVIPVLVLLLVVAGVGLAYPRCIRSRVKDKKYLSR